MKKILLMLAATCGLLGAVADDSAVAKVGDVEYTRFDEAMLAAIKQDEATVTILRDFKYAGQYTTNKFVGAGADVTKITIVNDYKVNFRTYDPGYGMNVDGLTLTLKGSGTWWKDAEGENIGHTNATMFVVGEKSAAANVIVESGTFYATTPKCLFNVQLGTITINGGTFQKVNSNEGGGWCVRAEKSEVDTTTGGVVIINGGTFEGPSDGQNAFIGPKSGSENYATIRINVAGDIKLKGTTAALANMKQYLVTEADGEYTSVADDYEFVRKGADGYYAAVATGTAVAKIGDIKYAEFDTALQDAIVADVATVTILKDFTFTNTIYMVGKGTDTTKVTIENEYVVDFPYEYSRYGIFVDDLTLTLTGNGTWQKPKEIASMFLAGEKSAAADIIVESGNFYAMYSSCIFNVQLGSITVNGGTFKTDNTSGKCVRAEKSDVAEANPDQFVDKAKAGVVIINGGSFEGPSNGTEGLIIVKDEDSVAAGAEVWINVEGDITLKGSETAIEQTSQYFRIKGTDEDGAITYTETEDYKFADKDKDGVYTICEIDWATLTINFDESAVQKVTVTDEAAETTEYTSTKAQYKCDKDDAEELTLAVTCKDGYELNMTEDALKVTMDQDRTVTIVTKASGGATYEAVEAGSTTACATAADATAMAAAINANKANLIKAPGNIVLTGDDLSTYVALFEATASGTDVTVALTADAEEALQKVVDDATVSFVMGESAAVFSVTNAVPGLYYVLYSGVEKPTDLPTKNVIQATSEMVVFSFETTEYNQAFFKVEACVTAPVQ